MVHWEYKSFRVTGPDLERKLNPLGAVGWELVNLVGCEGKMASQNTKESLGSAKMYRVVLKRPRQ